MATYFGEVQELVSRAVDPDDIEDPLIYNLATQTSENYTNELQIDSLIFCVGDIATAFSECFLKSKNSKPLLTVCYSSDKDEDLSLLYGGHSKAQKKKVAARVYATIPDVAVCEIPFNIPETIYMELLETILQHIKCLNAIVLTSAPLATFKGNMSFYPQSSILMYLATSEFTLPATFEIPRLQSPNFVSGIPAAVLTQFEILKKPAICVVNFTDFNVIDFDNVQAYSKLASISFLQKLTDKKDSQNKLIDYLKKHSNESNLYT